MYKEAYPRHKNTIEISAVQLILIAAVLIVTFVLPASHIANQRAAQDITPYTQQALAARQKQQGQVSGATTDTGVTIIKLPVLNTELNLNSEAGLLLIGGLLLAGVATIIAIYLLITPHKSQRLQ
jgi:hypothetical protein